MDPSRPDALAARAARPTTPKGTSPGPAKRLVTAAFPVFYALNRPSLQRVAEAAYDFALRWNGIAIGFPGR